MTRESLASLASAGFTRVSFGMQSAVPHVLATLERTHHPDNVSLAVAWAHAAGLATSVDLIYGTPGESLADWQASLDAAIALEPDHVSAYALVIEPGTTHGRAVAPRRGRSPRTRTCRPTCTSSRTQRLAAAGYSWYEVSNWARTPADALPPQRRLLDQPGLVGHRAGRAFVPGPAASGATVPDGVGGTSSTHARTRTGSRRGNARRRRRSPRRRGPRARVGHAAHSARGRHPGERRRSPRKRRGADRRRAARRARAIGGRLALTLRGRLLADRAVRELTAEPVSE